MQKSNGIKVRKLPLPLEISFGNSATVTDGLFSLSSKEASAIRIVDIDDDKYATVEIYPPRKEIQTHLPDTYPDTLLGTDLSKSKGKGKDYGQYRYFKRSNNSLYLVVEGGKRVRKLELGDPLDRNSPIASVARAVKQNFGMMEFSKQQLIQFIPKKLSYAQILKGTLDTMNFLGYLQKTQGTIRGRIKETYKATQRINEIIVTPEQT